MDKLQMAKALLVTEENAYTKGGQTVTAYGIAVSDSVDGLVRINLGGDTVSPEDDQAIEVETTFSVKEGDEVIVSLIGADGTGKTPIVIGVIGRMDELADDISRNRSMAELTPQHFFHNSQGAFVTSDDVKCDTFTGDGAETSFTLSGSPYNDTLLALYVAGASVTSGYSVRGTALTFTSAPTGSIVALWVASEMQAYAKMDSDSFDIVKATDTVASFGESTQVGVTDSHHFIATPSAFQVFRGADKVFEINTTDSLTASRSGGTIAFPSGTPAVYPIQIRIPFVQIFVSVTLNTTVLQSSEYSYDRDSFILTINPSDHTIVPSRLTYTADIYANVPSLTLGSRNQTYAKGRRSLAAGENVVAYGANSAAFGEAASARSNNQVAIGKYNIEDSNGTYVEIVGNGTSLSNRSNARTLDWDGNEHIAGEYSTPFGIAPVFQLLWVNSAPTSNFSAQTISLNLSSYDAVCIITKTTAPSSYTHWQFGLVGGNMTMANKASTSATQYGRTAQVAEDGITFSNGYNGGTAGAANCIPWYIYGIKGLQTSIE